jgi:hypothetical protein
MVMMESRNNILPPEKRIRRYTYGTFTSSSSSFRSRSVHPSAFVCVTCSHLRCVRSSYGEVWNLQASVVTTKVVKEGIFFFPEAGGCEICRWKGSLAEITFW